MPNSADSPDETYGSYKFRLKWNGRYVAGLSKVTSLTRTREKIGFPAGDAASATHHGLRGQSLLSAVTLEHGVTHDPAFVHWVTTMADHRTSAIACPKGDNGRLEVSLPDLRKDIVLEMYDEVGQKVMGFEIQGCWPSEFVMLPDMGTNGYTVGISILTLETSDLNFATKAGSFLALRPQEPKLNT